jgi:hypothetical protein
MPAPTTFDDYQQAFLARHDTYLSDRLSTVGSAIMVAGAASAVAGHRTAGMKASVAGFGVAVIAHLFQPGTLRDELTAIVRHPVWATRAEVHRITRRAAK